MSGPVLKQHNCNNNNSQTDQKQETAEDCMAGLSAIWFWKSTNQGQGQNNYRNQ